MIIIITWFYLLVLRDYIQLHTQELFLAVFWGTLLFREVNLAYCMRTCTKFVELFLYSITGI